MRWWLQFVYAVKSLGRRGDRQRELRAEMEFHLEERTEELIASGRTETEARREAQRELGARDRFEEECREAWGWRRWHELVENVKLAVRQMRKEWAYAAIILVTLGLCLGVNTAVFSMLSNVMFRPYPYPEAERLVRLGEIRTKQSGDGSLSVISVRKAMEREGIDAFESVGLYRGGGDNLFFDGQAFRALTGRVNATFFSTLGVPPALGRVFEPGEDQEGRTDVVILSHWLWASAFRGDPDVVGRNVEIEGMTFEVIGVMPEGFYFLSPEVSLWRPHVISAFETSLQAWNNNRLAAVARLKPGYTVEQAQAQLDVVDAALYEERPGRRNYIDRVGLRMVVRDYHEYRTRNAKAVLYLLQASVALVFIIGCVNVLNIVFVRTTARLREIALRLSLGASIARIARMLATEGLVYGLIGGVLGLGAGIGGVELIKHYELYLFPRIDSWSVDAMVVAYNFGLAALAGLVIGLIPLVVFWQRDLMRLIREGGQSMSADRRGSRTRRGLAIGQVALTGILLIGTGLLIRSLHEILQNEIGFRTDNLVGAALELPNASEPREQLDYGARLLERFNQLPDVSSAALSSTVPFVGEFGGPRDFHVEGQHYTEESPHPSIRFSLTQGPFFETMGIPLLAGRAFTPEDMLFEAPPVAVIDRQAAERVFAGENPIGRRLTHQLDGPYAARTDATWITIIGVVGTVRESRLDDALESGDGRIYLNAGAFQVQAQHFVMRVSARRDFNMEAFRAEVRQAMSEVRATVPSTELELVTQEIDETLADRTSLMRFLMAFGGLALVLSAIGVYGVLSYSAALRRKELGIRTALGASRGTILNLVFGQGIRIAAWGLMLALGGAVFLMKLIEDRLYQTSTFELAVYGGVAVVLLAVTAVASLIPAIRAVRVDPIICLRCD